MKCVCLFVCPVMRLAPLRPMRMKLGMVIGGKGRLCQKVTEVKGRVKFQVARIELKFGEGDAGPMVSAKGVSRRMPSQAK